MVWTICLAVTVLIAAAAVRAIFDRRLGRNRIIVVLLCCVAITYTLYIPPFVMQYDFVAALLGCFINMMQVISLDADYLCFYDLITGALGTGFFAKLYFVFLAAMHFLLPAVSAMTAVTVVMRCLTQMQVGLLKRHRRPLHVFTQVNDKSVRLARDIRRHDEKCDILFLQKPDENERDDLRRELHCVMLDADVDTIRPDAKRREVYFYCIAQEQEQNLTDALTILSRAESQERSVQARHHIFLFFAGRSAELLIDSVPKGAVNISLIDEWRTGAYDLLERYPLFRYANGDDIHVLVCGLSGAAKAFLQAAAWCGQIAGYRLRFSVVGREIEDQAADFRAAYPGLFTRRYQIDFYSYRNELEYQDILKEHCADVSYAVAACGSENETVERAVGLRRFFYRADERFRRMPPIFAYIESTEKAAAVAALTTAESNPQRRVSYEITPYGMVDELYSWKNMTGSDLELLSKNVHLVYEDIFSEDGIDVAAALERYNLFEVNKSSNRANALHIRCKLAMIGLDYTDDPDAQEVDFAQYLDEEMLEKLTLAEHDRWMAFLESEGWETADLAQVRAYQASGISRGRHNCPLLKLHPYICPFEELQDRSDALGLPDSTVYDRELIARIPDILHDKWGAAGKRYKIVKSNLSREDEDNG